MTHDLLRKKVNAEIDISPNGLGIYRIYSFLMNQTQNNQQVVREFMEKEGFSKTEIAQVKSRYNHYQNKCKVQARYKLFNLSLSLN